jgi:hypothetical protein
MAATLPPKGFSAGSVGAPTNAVAPTPATAMPNSATGDGPTK